MITHIDWCILGEQSVSKAVQLIKGESACWVNQNKLTKNKFAWQDDYWAVSVRERHSLQRTKTGVDRLLGNAIERD